jgi:hypothetical protein
MGTRTSQYLMVGVKLPYHKQYKFEGSEMRFEDEDDFYDFLDPYTNRRRGIEHHNGLCVIDDSMGGRYTMIGRVIEESEEHMPLYDSFDLQAVIEAHRETIEVVKELIQAQFQIEKPDVRVWIFTQFS